MLVSGLITGLSATLLPATAHAQPFTLVTSPDINSHLSFSTGATWVDVDDDGDLDIYVVTGFAANNNNVLYRSNGDGTFASVTGLSITTDGAESVCSTFGDWDNDGDIDGFVSNLVNAGGMLFDGGATGIPGNPANPGGFGLNTTAGIGGAGLKGTGAAWGDYDNDGHLDLVIAALFGQGGITTPNRLFHNNGNGTFSEVTTGPLVTVTDSHHHPTWADHDGDGDIDLFFGTGGPGFAKLDRLYRNQLKETGIASFTPITTGVIATDLRDSQVLSWVDYDNDGDLDMYAINYSSVPNQLYRNDGTTFTKITTGDIVTGVGAAHGVAWGDFDNDGDQDAYVVRDSGGSNRYYRNNGNGTFTRITAGAFVTEGLSNYGVAAGDYDRDGDLDIFLPTARNEGASALYRNDLPAGNHWFTVRCRGTISNRSAIGAVVRIKAAIGGSPRWQRRDISAGTSYGGHNALEAHFGLAGTTLIDTLRIEWPSGLVDILTALPADHLLTVIENSSTPLAAAVLAAESTPRGIRIEWRLPGATDRTIGIERAVADQASGGAKPFGGARPFGSSRPFDVSRPLEAPPSFAFYRSVTIDTDGRILFHDDAVEPGRRYGYRLDLGSDAGSIRPDETWVDVVAGLSIRRAGPNPAGGAIRLDLVLASHEPATVDLIDITGRLLATRRMAEPSPGRFTLVLEDTADLPAGLYLARLAQGPSVAVVRIVRTR